MHHSSSFFLRKSVESGFRVLNSVRSVLSGLKPRFQLKKFFLRHKTLLYSIFRLFQSLSSKKLVIFFSIADKVDDTFALIEVQTKNIEFAESFSVRCRCVKEAQEGGRGEGQGCACGENTKPKSELERTRASFP